MSREPADGTAIVLHLIEAAREFVSDSGADPVDLAHWVGMLEARYQREQPKAEPVGWEPRRWWELVSGDRVAMGGVEAEVVRTAARRWHVDPKSSEYRPTPLEHTEVSVTLRWGTPPADHTYSMPPEGEVETLRGQAGQAVDEANSYRSALAEEPVNVMESWAADAAATLEAAGLGPVEVIR